MTLDEEALIDWDEFGKLVDDWVARHPSPDEPAISAGRSYTPREFADEVRGRTEIARLLGANLYAGAREYGVSVASLFAQGHQAEVIR